MEYKIVNAYCEQYLSEIVNNLFNEGWKPQGGVAILPATEFNRTTYYQTLILEKIDE